MSPDKQYSPHRIHGTSRGEYPWESNHPQNSFKRTGNTHLILQME